jgi:hypothetical protein
LLRFRAIVVHSGSLARLPAHLLGRHRVIAVILAALREASNEANMSGIAIRYGLDV